MGKIQGGRCQANDPKESDQLTIPNDMSKHKDASERFEDNHPKRKLQHKRVGRQLFWWKMWSERSQANDPKAKMQTNTLRTSSQGYVGRIQA